jgi:hypothetical protein
MKVLQSLLLALFRVVQRNIFLFSIEEFSPYGVPIPGEAAKGDGFPVVTLTVGVSR